MESTDRSLELPTNLTHRVRIDALQSADSPRLAGVDTGHVQRLAEIQASLPPILVHRPTMRIVDGSHRVAAAVLRGLDSVEVHYFDGPEADSFLRSVSANVAHGLPLSTPERKAAAERILHSHADMSDRAVATHTGLDAKTVAGIRRGSTEDVRQSNTRIGADGKAHPLDRTAERIRAAELMTSRPDLPLRAIVKETGLSLGTAHDVRQRLLRGEAPIPSPRRGAGPGAAPARGPAAPAPAPARAHAPDAVPAAAAPARRAGPAPAGAGRTRTSLDLLRGLTSDPSLRHSESGRHFLRWLHTHFVLDDAWRQQVDSVPPHSTATVAELALQCSHAWRRFAEELASRRLTDVAGATTPQPAQESRK
ncbi:ParB/RepB/Spo0J family partition protein [Streptomyces sp. H34-S4]|uniref:ParB/RepB/Spo0J family partition protein n=1 Tax=Streptomyces sp. H34-S4 TaxID=2996463 RepID=UPI0022709E20|nr:transcriptional regulator [Streptomyces sp. H34-S4]MCY0937376.1 transcriptional regulator [Streptomyces sp. H34-S4]